MEVTPGLEVSISASAGDTVLCVGESATLTVNVDNGNAPFTYVWSDNFTGEERTEMPTATTPYSVTVTDATGCSGEADLTIVVNPNPTVAVSADRTTICVGESANLSAEGSGGTAPYTYSWSNGFSGENQAVSPGDTTLYVVTVTDANGCGGTDSLRINVPEAAEVTIVSDKMSICLGDSAVITTTASGGSVPYTFNWDNGITGFVQVVRPTQTTTYSVTVTDGNGCRDTSRVTVTVSPAFQITITADDESICEGDSATLTAGVIGGIEPYNFFWNTSETSASIVVSEAGNYSVTVTDATGCSGSDDIEITVTQPPVPTISTDIEENIVCAGDPVVLSATSVGGTGNVTYTWSNGITGTQQTVNLLETTTYIVTATDENGCNGVDSVTIQIFPIVIAEVEITSPRDTICPGETVKLRTTATSGTEPFTFEWDNDLGMGAEKEVSPSITTTYNVTVTDGNGCINVASVTIVVAPVNATVPQETIVCLPTDDGVLTVTNLDPTQVLTYQWSPENAIIGASNTQTITVDPTISNAFTVVVTNQFGCRDTLEAGINILNLPALINATVNPDTINRGESAQLDVTGCPDCDFAWTPAGSLNNPNIANPTASPEETTIYTVTATLGICTAQDTVTLFVRFCDPAVYLPNAFTPNGDGVNDIFRMRSNSLDQLQSALLVVYNRWGQEVFRTTDPNIGWDGTLNGRQLPPDVYGWIIRTTCPDGQRYEAQGNVTLLR